MVTKRPPYQRNARTGAVRICPTGCRPEPVDPTGRVGYVSAVDLRRFLSSGGPLQSVHAEPVRPRTHCWRLVDKRR